MKKKLLCFLVVLALMLTMVATIVACAEEEGGVEAAKEYLEKFYKTKKFDSASYTVLGIVKLDDGKTYKIDWSADKDTVEFVKGETMVTVNVTKTAEDQTYTLTATISDDAGNKATATFQGSIEKDPNADGKLGSTYYMFVNQSNSGKLIWMTGEFDSSYNQLKTNDSKDAAIAWFAEDIANSQAKKIYFVENNANTYLGVAAGQYTNLSLVDAAANAAQWTIAADGTFKTTVDESEFFLGVNGTYNTVSLRPIGDLGIYMPAQLTTTPDAVKATATIKASELNEYSAIEFTSPAAANGGVTAEVGSTVKFKVNPDNGCTVTSVKVGGKTVTATEGVYSATLEKNCTIAVAVDNPNARAEYLNATIAVGARTSGSAAQSVWAIEGATLTSIKGDSNTDCYATEGRFYSKSTIKLECDGMLRVVLTTKTGYNEGLRGVEIFDTNGTKIEGAKVLVDGTTTVILFNEAVDAFVTGKLSAQVRITEVKIYTGEDNGVEVNDGSLEKPYTAAEAAAICAALPGVQNQSVFNDKVVYVKGIVSSVDSQTSFYLATGGAKDLQIYNGQKDESVSSKTIYVNDEVIVSGYLCNYSNGYKFEFALNNDVKPTVHSITTANGTIKSASTNSQDITVAFVEPEAVEGVVTAINGTTVKFSVTVPADQEITSVKVNGKDATKDGDNYTVVLSGDMEIVVATKAQGDKTLAMDFSVATQRESTSSSKQVWKNDGITLTNEGSVGDYTGPVRLYKNSTVKIEATGMKSITFTCNTAAYATSLGKSIPESVGTVTVNGKLVTITFSAPVDSVTLTMSDGQVRVDSMTVTVAG